MLTLGPKRKRKRSKTTATDVFKAVETFMAFQSESEEKFMRLEEQRWKRELEYEEGRTEDMCSVLSKTLARLKCCMCSVLSKTLARQKCCMCSALSKTLARLKCCMCSALSKTLARLKCCMCSALSKTLARLECCMCSALSKTLARLKCCFAVDEGHKIYT